MAEVRARSSNRGPQDASSIATKICAAFSRSGWCQNGTKCRFHHDRGQQPAPITLANRQWGERKDFNAGLGPNSPQGSRTLRIMSYNMLADDLANLHAKELYKAVPAWCLEWRHRFKLLFQEISHWRPDIAGLQEVDHFEQFRDDLAELGYDGKFAPRSGIHTDGCFTCWQRDQYTEACHSIISFQDHKLQHNVALLVLLVPKHADAAGPPVLVANTHCLFNPKRGDIKMGQVRMIAERMADMREAVAGPVALFLMGDFNSTANSAVYRFLQAGFLDCSTEDRRDLSGQLAHQHNYQDGWTRQAQNGFQAHAPPPKRPTPSLQQRHSFPHHHPQLYYPQHSDNAQQQQYQQQLAAQMPPPPPPDALPQPQHLNSNRWGPVPNPPSAMPIPQHSSRTVRFSQSLNNAVGGAFGASPEGSGAPPGGQAGPLVVGGSSPMVLSNPCTPRASLDGVPELQQPAALQVFRSTSAHEHAPASCENSWTGSKGRLVHHSVSFPCMPAMAELDADQAAYMYVDQFGQQTWSNVPPPATVNVPRHMFFHDPMYCEEASPSGPPPHSILRSVSDFERKKYMATWTMEQLTNAVGPSTPAPPPLPAPSTREPPCATPANAGEQLLQQQHQRSSIRFWMNAIEGSGGGLEEGSQQDLRRHGSGAAAAAPADTRSFPATPSVFSTHEGPPPASPFPTAEPSSTPDEGSAHSGRQHGGSLLNLPSSTMNARPSGGSVNGISPAKAAAAASLAQSGGEHDSAVQQALAARLSSEWTTTGSANRRGQDLHTRASGGRPKSRRNSMEDNAWPGREWIARHPLQLQSACQDILGCELPYTSCHGKFIGTVDFVWFSPQAGSHTVVPCRVLLPPPLESLHCGLPSQHWPSDHISLVFDFVLLSSASS
ncbi:hypothetical protein WJX73_009972 [Symbiochloris irregularis]|uniref:C3H1-type domain-containing protein n=1 Tax=Symbiochloris irregularis TaxID=706552 RepID=A0AAW1NW34_9CHLO